jgi:hypothetical protein
VCESSKRRELALCEIRKDVTVYCCGIRLLGATPLVMTLYLFEIDDDVIKQSCGELVECF